MATLATIDPILKACFLEQVSLELLSPPGLGKTSKIKQISAHFARQLKAPFGLSVRHLSTYDPTEVGGMQFIGHKAITKHDGTKLEFESALQSYPALFPQPSDKVYMPDGTTTTIAKLGYIPKYGYVMLDELRQAPHDSQKPAARLLDERTLGEYSLDNFGHWAVTACSNSSEDRSGAQKELAFVTNRKCVIKIDPCVRSLQAYMEQAGLHHSAIGFMRAFPDAVFTEKVPSHENPYATPRSFERCIRLLTRMGKEDKLATSPEALETACGLIGEASATKLMGFLRRTEDMVTVEEILESPTTTKVPDRPDIMWATVQLMVHHATIKNVLTMMKYVQRMPQEFQISAVSSLHRKVPGMANEPEWVEWAAKNKDLLLAAHAAMIRV